MNRNDLIDSVAVGIWAVALVAGVLLVTAQLIDILKSLTLTLTHPYSLSYTGGYLGYYVAHPFELYQAPDPVPHPTIYPPLVPLLVPKIPGVNVYISTRAANWLAIAGSAALLAWLTRERTGRRANAGVTALLFLMSAAIVGATVLLRVDHIALFLTLAAVVAYERDWRLAGVAALCVAAGFAKQPYAIVSTGAIVAALWVRGDRRLALRFGTATAVFGLALLALLAVLTDGWALTHLFRYNLAVPWYQEVWLSQLHTFLYTHGLLIGVAVGVVLGFERWQFRAPIAWVFVIGLGVALVTIGKEGAWIGYFYPAIAAGAVLFGDIVEEVDPMKRLPTRRRVLSVFVILLIVGQLYLYTIWFPFNEKPLEAQTFTADQLETVDGAILAEEPSLAPENEPVDVLMVQGLINGGELDGDPLARALRCGRYEMVVTWLPVRPDSHELSRFTEPQLQAIAEHYVPVYPRRNYYLYRYNGTATCRD